MSKNIFSKLKNNDNFSDSEDEQGQNKKVMDRKEKKRVKDMREENLREHYGDKVVKDPYQKDKKLDGPKQKNDYGNNDKRPYDRKSGTGKQAFGNKPKKGGHGKGNVGKLDENNLTEVQENEEVETNNKENIEPVEEVEEFINLEDYLKENGRTIKTDLKEDVTTENIKNDDDNLVLVKKKEKINKNRKQKKDNDVGINTLSDQIYGRDENERRYKNKNYNNKRSKHVKVKDNREFPTLS